MQTSTFVKEKAYSLIHWSQGIIYSVICHFDHYSSAFKTIHGGTERMQSNISLNTVNEEAKQTVMSDLEMGSSNSIHNLAFHSAYILPYCFSIRDHSTVNKRKSATLILQVRNIESQNLDQISSTMVDS